MRTPDKQWIQCRVSPGMFSDERVVEVRGRSFFVEERVTRNVKDGFGELEVTIVDSNGGKWIVLPTNYKDSVPYGP